MPGEVAESLRTGQRTQHPSRLRREIQDVAHRQARRNGHTVLDVLVPLTIDLQVQRDDQRRASRQLRALDERRIEAAVTHHIELEPEWRGRFARHFFDRTDADGGQRERHAKALCRARAEHFAVSPLHTGQPCRRNGDGHRDRLTDHRAGSTAALDIDCYALLELQVLKCRAVLTVRGFRIRTAVDIIVERLGHAPFCKQA